MNAQSYALPNFDLADADLFRILFNLPGNFGNVNNYVSASKILVYLYGRNGSHNSAVFNLEVTVTI